MNIGYKTCMDCSERKRLLNEIGKVDFVITELNLYLDTHPYDQQAIDIYNQYINIKTKLTKEFTDKFGPIVRDCINPDSREWKWALQDWPWEGGYY